MGVYEHLMLQVEEAFKDLKNEVPERFKAYRDAQLKVFNHLLASLDMSDTDLVKPMDRDVYSDPFSPEVQLILNLYSMEPPVHADLNNASRDLDLSKLVTLGPFAKAISGVLVNGNISDREREDTVGRGDQFHNPKPWDGSEPKIHRELGYMCKSFLLFRGALMKDRCVTDWRRKIDDEDFNLKGITSTNKDLDVALGYSKCHTDYADDQQPVLFVFSMWNYFGFQGFRLNHKRYSMYPGE